MHTEKDPAVEHTAGPEECGLFVAGEVGDAVKALLQVFRGQGHMASTNTMDLKRAVMALN